MSATLANMAASTTLTPEQRSLRAKAAAHAQWANESDRQARTAAGRQAANDRFARQVDPDGELPEAERQKRAESARRAHMLSLAAKSAKARKRK